MELLLSLLLLHNTPLLRVATDGSTYQVQQYKHFIGLAKNEESCLSNLLIATYCHLQVSIDWKPCPSTTGSLEDRSKAQGAVLEEREFKSRSYHGELNGTFSGFVSSLFVPQVDPIRGWAKPDLNLRRRALGRTAKKGRHRIMIHVQQL